MNQHEVVAVSLGERSYEIVVGQGVLGRAGAFIAPILRQPRLIVVTDENVAPLHLETLHTALAGAGIRHDDIILPAGEQTKDFAHLEDLIDRLLAMGIERGTTIAALGGGVIGDIAGFAAAIALRGLDFVQIPTTLLAQVDSSVGGKTAINTRAGKNLVGAFHQPRLVVADTGVLDTLPHRELLAGYAEVVKYGLIDNAPFFSWLEGHGMALLEGDAAARQRAIVQSCRSKAAIVADDERETGQRALLNLGHTFGHALEAETGFSDALLHGEAVSIGMLLAFDLSVQLGLCPAEDADRVHRHFAAVGLPTHPGQALGSVFRPEDLIAHMRKDKKVVGGTMRFVLARGIGKSFVTDEVDAKDLVTLLEGAMAT